MEFLKKKSCFLASLQTFKYFSAIFSMTLKCPHSSAPLLQVSKMWRWSYDFSSVEITDMCIWHSVRAECPDTPLWTLAGRVNTSTRCVLLSCVQRFVSFPSRVKTLITRKREKPRWNVLVWVKRWSGKGTQTFTVFKKRNPHIINKSIWL